jgi:HEAT repeat protein
MSDPKPVTPEFDPASASVFAAFCPACWSSVSFSNPTCPRCGASIAKLSGDPYAEKLQRALHHPIGEIRERAARLLGEIGGPEAQPVLLGLVRQETDTYLASAALEGLARLLARHPELPPIDWEAFTRSNYPLLVRVAAARILRSGGKP